MKKLFFALPLLLLVAACGPTQLDAQQRTNTELGARQYAGNSSDFQSCSGQDSDNDGYVTCTLRGRTAPHAVEEIVCAYKAIGCKRKS